MDRLKFEQWWATDDKSAPNPKEYAWQAWQAAINSQSLSQEAVRDEALEIPNEVCRAGMDAWNDTFGSPYTRYAAIYRAMQSALKREPNAAPTREESRQDWDAVLSVGPAPAAPDVARMVKRLRDYRCADPWAGSLMIEAAALLAKLGQGWIPPETVIEIDEDGKVHPEGVKLKNLRPGASDE